MKKFVTLALSAVLAAGGAATLAQNVTTVKADDPVEIKAVAQYDFDDETDIGKDSSGNGFNLAKKDTSASTDSEKGVSYGEEEGVSYVKLRRTSEDDASPLRGGILYAPFFSGTTQDFSDMMTGSYTVTMKFRGADIPNRGDYYLLHTGKYNSSVAITPWNNKIEIEPVSEAAAPTGVADGYDWTQTQKVNISANTNEGWHTVTIVGDQRDNTVTIYYNGEQYEKVTLNDGAKPLLSANTAGGSGPYTFCIGGQAEGNNGNASVMYCSADVDYTRVYDVPLSAANVARLYNGQEAVLDTEGDYITAVETIDFSKYDLKVTDTNTLKKIKASLPKMVKVTTSSDATKSVSVNWYETGRTIRGYLQCGVTVSNELGLMPSTPFGYTVRLTYDEDLIDIAELQLDGKTLVSGADVEPNIAGTLTIKIAPKAGVQVTGFYLDDMEWLVPDDSDYIYDEDEGYYFFEIGGPVNVEIYAEMQSSTVTYYDGTEKLGTSKYSVGGNEALKTFDKEGYEFNGWYTDAALKNAFTGLDYTNPTDITLYAKYTAIGGGEEEGGKGCNGSLATGAVAVAGALLTAGVVVLATKKKKKN